MTSIQHKIVSFVLFNALWLSAVSGRENYIVLSGVLLAWALSILPEDTFLCGWSCCGWVFHLWRR
ncbi:hypothetical protein V6D52_13800 [Idiomarina loihiensis]|uniref:hypothetical protein n=1 Tax=Idiomarina TaxID=135575 RepID=UPI00257F5613|nr:MULTISPECIES: hypothetical protein [unclassified Idiomarina]|tara:strand:+ start:57427 stop:57621 length:195 start_codon:yes stop_codon:yes gene_type:complete